MNIDTDELFFEKNVININRIVSKILLSTAIVPLSFIILTLLGIWRVPHGYSVSIIIYSIVTFLITILLNRYRSTQKVVQYLGIIFTAGFVELLAIKNVIAINVTYAAVPFLSCLYYNRRLTLCATFSSFALMLIALYVRSSTVLDVMREDLINWQSIDWFISNSIGFSIEFTFICMIAIYMGRRSNNTINSFFKTMNEKKEKEALLKVQNKKLQETQDKIIGFVANVLGSHDLFTGRHVMHTKVYIRLIAEKMVEMGFYTEELSEETIHLYETAAFLHDLGKIHIPEGVLNKIGKFTDAEFEIMKSHPEEGKKLLEFLPKIGDGSFNEIAKEIAFTHHEKWNGKGYPRGIKEKEIPLCGRIMAAADVLDALISKRLYKDPFSIDEALKIFEESKGEHFEECIAEAVICCREKIIEIDAQFKKNEAETEEKEFNWWKNYHDNLKQVALS